MKRINKIRLLAGLAGLAWAGLTAAVAANQKRILFNPVNKREVDRPASSGHRTRQILLRSQDGTRLHGWLMTPYERGPHPAVVYFGGRSEEVSWVARDAGSLFPGMAVLAVNYRGYGDSHGAPAEEHLIADGCMLYQWLADRHHVDAGRVAVVGRSLGTGVAVQVAQRCDAHSVVLITPYDSILSLAKRKFRAIPIEYVLKHRFESVKHAALLKAPTYVLRAAVDDVVPHAHTDLLVERLGPLLHADEIVPDSDHLNIPYLAATQERIASFLAGRFAEVWTETAGEQLNALPEEGSISAALGQATGG
jgi:dipeptidyl aminopeptidase/acylaminoacyl peptidase